MPFGTKKIFHNKVGNEWVSETDWDKLIKSKFGFGQGKTSTIITLDNNVRVPFTQFFHSLDKQPFIVFFNTRFGPDAPGWYSLMSATGYMLEDKNIGKYIVVNGISRYGYPINAVRDLEDVLFELEGDDVLLLIGFNKIQTAFLGDVDDYPELLEMISFNFT